MNRYTSKQKISTFEPGAKVIRKPGKRISYTPYQVAVISRALTDMVMLDTYQIPLQRVVNFWTMAHRKSYEDRDEFLFEISSRVGETIKINV